ncbi:NACHT domain-containing protein [Iningainema tapete]|uniref:NACHT domain-containing NTPase n=1 Tax=Iningainema tapete BLCC-T55 TaxID=2748662 RepID=A0A8J7C3Y3_9CYAN|nr:NACHT domain-containing NTPase [Iningainema tapete]MBD2770654.1 NACHT domain-containing NTPase [Iningainema tapete BLCC-T55]
MAEQAKRKKAKRSLQACPDGIDLARKSLTNKGLSQQQLEERVQLSHPTVTNFFRGTPVDRTNFVRICNFLNLDWQEITGEAHSHNEEPNTNINLVQQVREKIKPHILERCGTMRVLDMNQPIELNDIYTNVNILEKITGRQRREIEELVQNFNTESDEFARIGLGKITQKRIPGLEAVERHSKLMVLGKPGAGKTTFLKYLAIQCISENFQANRIPIFITLKQFAETQNKLGLQEFILQELGNNLITDTQISELLTSGRFLILLDGLDEVREEDSSRVINQIKEFSEKYHNNQFVVTCRIAAREYTYEKFTEVEVADFNKSQISEFVNKWFKAKDDLVKAERFIKKLEEDEPIQELATSPLLLTLLCLVFEESGNFPSNRSELYKEGLDVLLKKWDVKRNIERDQVYKKLSLKRKEDLLSQIALNTFEQGNYFFKQKEVERYITEYIQNLPEANTDPETLQLDSEAVLKSIEAQHGLFVERARGIYSFSHLTFHEYFTARKLVSSANPYAVDDKTLQALATRITEKRWREVFLLTVGMLDSADKLLQLMQQKIDKILESDEKLQQFLTWVEKKSESVEAPYKPAAVRAFYFALALDRNQDFDSAFDRNQYQGFTSTLDLYLHLASTLDRDLNLALSFVFYFDQDRAFYRDLSPELKQSLLRLKRKHPKQSTQADKQWWQENGQAWTEQLRAVMIEHRNIGHDWQFTNAQKELLKQYYDANKLLVDCLNSDCYVSREVRQKIDDSLLFVSGNTK